MCSDIINVIHAVPRDSHNCILLLLPQILLAKNISQVIQTWQNIWQNVWLLPKFIPSISYTRGIPVVVVVVIVAVVVVVVVAVVAVVVLSVV